jgi:hypothetical protein
MTSQLRHRCRNPRCRLKLPAPVEIEHRALCCRGCYESFYLTRCRVCERDLRKTGKRGDAQRLYCRAPSRCAAEARKWPEKYGFGAQPVPDPLFCRTNVSAHSGPAHQARQRIAAPDGITGQPDARRRRCNLSDWRPTGNGAGVPDFPHFLLRNSTASDDRRTGPAAPQPQNWPPGATLEASISLLQKVLSYD